MDRELIARRWDAEYRLGRYADDPPLRFVGEILDALRGDPVARDGIGLYVGCGNGRNRGCPLEGLSIPVIVDAIRQETGCSRATAYRAIADALADGTLVQRTKARETPAG